MSQNVYFILGASSDLGLELVRQLDQENSGCLFLAHYNSSKERLQSLELHNGNKMECLQADLSDMQAVDALTAGVKKFCDAPTHIVHLAALPFRYMKLKDFDRDSFVKSMDVQVCSFAKVMQAFLPTMAKRKQHDKVVVVASSVVASVPKFVLEYSTVKRALLGFVKSLAADYAGKKVNINAVSPSMIETNFLRNIDPRLIAAIAESAPEQRLARAQDIVPLIKFLLSDSANYIHGENIVINNGESV